MFSLLRRYSSTKEVDDTPINGEMSATQILERLTEHGCKDVSSQLKRRKGSQLPASIGGYGIIYKGKLAGKTKVAIKCLRLKVGTSVESRKDLKRAAHELYVWSKCQHPNILELTGVAVFHDQVAMVSPWMERGTVTWFISENPLVDRYNLCAQIAEGVAYLHSNGFVHGDLKGDNILVSNEGIPKITDFGAANMSKYTLQFDKSTGLVGMTLRWAAPELVNHVSGNNAKTDIYALGMTFLEIITGSPPYCGVLEPAVMRMVTHNIHPARSTEHIPTGSDQHDKMWSLLEACWTFDPQERPTSSQVLDQMKLIAPHEPNYESLSDVLSFLSSLGYSDYTDMIAASVVTSFREFSSQSHDIFKATITPGGIGRAIFYLFLCPNNPDYRDQWKANRAEVRSAYIWSKCNHPNILRPFGFAEYHGRLARIYSPMAQFIKSTWSSNPDLDRLRQCIIQVVNAVAYLHGQGVVHGSIGKANVMVSEGGDAALKGSINTTFESDGPLFRRDPLTEPYFRNDFKAPEHFSYQLIPTKQGDVWSLGLTMAEIVTRRGYEELGIELHPKHTTPERPKVDALRSPRGERFWELVRACRRIKPKDRPTAAQVLEELKAIADVPSNQDQSKGWKL